jgi:hypothetical protein
LNKKKAVKVAENLVSYESPSSSRYFLLAINDAPQYLTSSVRKIAKHMQCTRVRFVNDIIE